jgi:hypothetical protein
VTDKLPIEDPENGLYLHRAAIEMPDGVNVLVLEDSLVGVPRYYVPAESFMDVQKDRDDFRRAMSLVNAWRVTQRESYPMLDHLCASVGLTDTEGRAVNDIVRGMREIT